MVHFLSTLSAVARRELHEWRLVWVAAVLLGALAFVSPWLPSMNRYSSAEVRELMLLTFLALLNLALVLFMGARLVNRDMAEGRFAFYLVRPIPSAALWFGRLVGAMVVIQVASLLVLAPTWIAHPEEVNLVQSPRLATPWTASSEALWAGYFGQALLPQSWGRAGSVIGILIGILVSLLVVHAIATFVQSRNAWLVLDLVALSTTVALTSWAADQLISRQALGPLVWAERFFGGWLAVALLVASSVQIVHGRSDPERGRRLFSMVLWPLLLVGTLGQVAFASWITSPGVEALVTSPSPPVRLSSSDSSSGEWLFLGGATHFREGYRAAFLLEARGGRTLRLGALDVTRASLRAADEAEILIGTRCSRLTRNQDCELWTLDLQEAQLEPRPTGVPVPAQGEMVLSPDGSLVALEHLRQWSFHEVETGRLVWTSKEEFAAVVFQPMDRVLLYRPVEGQIGILELDLSRRSEVGPAGLQPKSVGRLDGTGPDIRVQPFPKAGRIFVHQAYGIFSVHDARTGDTLIAPRSVGGWSGPHFLSADRFAFISWKGEFSVKALQPWAGRQAEIILFSSDAATERRYPLPGHNLRIGNEIPRGRLLIGLTSAEQAADIEAIEPGLPYWSLYELDLKSGEVVPRLHGVAPLRHWNRRIDALEESLLEAGNGAVIGWSPETGKIRPILPVIDP